VTLYLIRRLALAAVMVFVVASSAMLLAGLAPGDATGANLFGAVTDRETIERERARLGLDQPLLVQYARWAGRVVRFDFGISFRYDRPVAALVAERAANTAILASAALVLATLLGLVFGALRAARMARTTTLVGQWVSLVTLSCPPLVLSMLFAIFAARTGWFPVSGMGPPADPSDDVLTRVFSLARAMTLPTLALALPMAATLERLQASSMARTLREPFVVTAMAIGVPRPRVLWKHAFRVAVVPILAVYGTLAAALFSGSFGVEIVTAWPGLGRLMYEALLSRDVALVAGCAAAGATLLALGNVASDMALVMADPRVAMTRDGAAS
jgi:peptide/nickel transport system permease protein